MNTPANRVIAGELKRRVYDLGPLGFRLHYRRRYAGMTGWWRFEHWTWPIMEEEAKWSRGWVTVAIGHSVSFGNFVVSWRRRNP